MSSVRLKENSELRRAQVAAFSDSDMTAKEWCAEYGMSPSTLHYWRRKLREEGASCSSWVDISELGGDRGLDSSCTAIVPVGHGCVTVRVGPFSIEVTRAQIQSA